ncbi:MAG TPA: CHC2 zinc finger domain-containing protein [Thermomicrobiales bacterium]|nr:CHC2 zinc finger domain-containing protein [Thermomicrobiales bacterium]
MTARVDTAALRRRYPLAGVVARYGVRLRRVGGHHVGRCPFHDDREPSLVLYVDDPRDEHFHCFGCRAHGDVIHFVELIERLPFRAAVAALTGITPTVRGANPGGEPAQRPAPTGVRDPAGRACLAVATALYHGHLLRDGPALAYCAGRGLDRATLARCRVGYAAGGDLAAALRHRGLDPAPAVRAGLLDPDGRERLAGRLVVPELRAGGPLWLIGRALDAGTAPRYLGLRGPKPLLGWAEARGHAAVCLTEGVIDRLVLSGWGYPALALAGTRAAPAARAALARFRRVYLVLDADDAGRAATAALAAALGARARVVSLLAGGKDVADLARRPGGRAAFARALALAGADPAALTAA